MKLETLPLERQKLKDLPLIPEEAQIRLVKELEDIVKKNGDYFFETKRVAEIRNGDLEPEEYSVFIEGTAYIFERETDKWISSDEDDTLSTEIELVVWIADDNNKLNIDDYIFI